MRPGEIARQFNAANPIGTPVRVWPGVKSGKQIETRTRTEARVLHGEPVIWVEGAPGCFALTHVEVIR